jgi:hypothetical protein
VPAAGGNPARVIAAGGFSDAANRPGLIEVLTFDEPTGLWSPFGVLSMARGNAGAAGLADGSAIVFGGANQASATQTFASTERTGTAKTAATTCTGGGECASGFCVDGVCCDTACADACDACAEPGSVGTCVTITGPTRAGHPACNGGTVGDPKCGYQCNGSGPTASACTYVAATVVCAPATCTAGGIYSAPTKCNGGGGACPAQTQTNCAPFGCNTAGCKTACATDADCALTGWCDTTGGVCKAKLDDGKPATAASQCKSGFAADGVCCHTACTGACTSCAIAGSEGTCGALADGKTDVHGVCPVGACSTCTAGACAVLAKGTACGADACSRGVLTTAGTCDGSAVTCPSATITPCLSGLACAGGKRCKSACAGDGDCQVGVCDLAHGICVAATDAGVVDTGADVFAEAISPQPTVPPLTQAFQRCEHDADCKATGHCVEGVCCDTACTDRCHSCALPSSPGKCTPEPLGTDLRNECGPSLSCLGTCDGLGACIGAGPGSQCAHARCDTASSGVGPAFCASAGSACDINAVVAFECAPFACEPAFGACRTSCVTTNDCAPGNDCDTTTQQCVKPAPASSSNGCATSGGGVAEGGLGALVLAGVVLARRRRARGA